MAQCSCPNTVDVRAQRQTLIYNEMITFIPHRKPTKDAAPINVFPIMRLPWELRQRVYYLHFQQPKKRDVLGGECPAGDRCPIAVYNDYVPVRELILASKLIYREAMPIYYRTKTFTFKWIQNLWRFLRIIGPAQRSYVAHICFNLRGTRARHGYRLLADCPRLQSLEIVLGDFDPSQDNLEPLYRVRGLKSIKLTVLPYRNWVNPDDFKAALQALLLPYDRALTPLGPARAFALDRTPRTYFGANYPTKRALSVLTVGAEDVGSDKTETVFTKAKRGLEDDQRQTGAKRIKLEAQV
ncbi:MAG: hypothetical protein HETSPECPRED_005141 [Heterodermia speciosa]|uniref:Uncharacterized protein n=1 Tax=Heterodermia speciosa TaxID=116794 RepID=A0A8H3FDS7_9LECA|nr:MAG: hypothetical protein HETSPECPRED_005141 [Heterodermia speciosa]